VPEAHEIVRPLAAQTPPGQRGRPRDQEGAEAADDDEDAQADRPQAIAAAGGRHPRASQRDQTAEDQYERRDRTPTQTEPQQRDDRDEAGDG
jgi:hypothetical protein